MLMFHKAVFLEYKEIKEKIDNNFMSIFRIKKELLSNFILPILVFGFVLFAPFLSHSSTPNYSSSNNSTFLLNEINISEIKEPDHILLNAVFAYFLEALWLLGVSMAPLIVEGNWNSRLNESTIEGSVFGLLYTLGFSGALTVVWIFLISPSVGYLSLITAVGGIVIMAYIVDNIRTTALRLLWKVEVPGFADNLPHLIVKTKTGNIFFGQLYDPLDDKALILRNANLVIHGGREVSETLEKITFGTIYAKDGAKELANYISIPWDDIEALQIVEDGLYKPLKTNAEE